MDSREAAAANGFNKDHVSMWARLGHIKGTQTGVDDHGVAIFDVDPDEVAAVKQWVGHYGADGARPLDVTHDFMGQGSAQEQDRAACRWVQRRAEAKDASAARAKLGQVALTERALRVGFATFTPEMKSHLVRELLDATHASGAAQANVEVVIRKYLEGGK